MPRFFYMSNPDCSGAREPEGICFTLSNYIIGIANIVPWLSEVWRVFNESSYGSVSFFMSDTGITLRVQNGNELLCGGCEYFSGLEPYSRTL